MVESIRGVPSPASGAHREPASPGAPAYSGDHDHLRPVQLAPGSPDPAGCSTARTRGHGLGQLRAGRARRAAPRPRRRRDRTRSRSRPGDRAGAGRTRTMSPRPGPAAAAGCPEQVGVLLAAGGADRPVGGDDLEGAQVVAARPCVRMSTPMPPPRVRPAMPVWDTSPPGIASPNSWVARSTSPHGRAGLGAGGARHRVDVHGLHRREVDHQTGVTDGAAGDLVPAAADADRSGDAAGPPAQPRRRQRCPRSGRSPRGGGRSARSTPGGPRRSRRCRRSITSPCMLARRPR